MNLLQLQYFCTVAELENISKAAARFNIPQPSLSATISKLEKELGVPLFDRHKNRIILNQAGKKFLSYIRQSLELIDEGVESVHQLSDEPEGSINIYIGQSHSLITNCILAFHKLYPKITFLATSDHSSIDKIRYDLYIDSPYPKKGYYNEFILDDEDILLVLPKKHPLARREILQISDLKNLSFIVPSLSSTCYNVANELCKKNGFELNVIMSCELDIINWFRFIYDGVGVSFFGEKAIKSMFNSKVYLERFSFLKIDSSEMRRKTSIFYSIDKPLSTNAKLFLEFFKKFCSKAEGHSVDSIIM